MGNLPPPLLPPVPLRPHHAPRGRLTLGLLARGFAAAGDPELADFYRALGDAEERHAEIFLDLARPLVDAGGFADRVEDLGQREAEIFGVLPHQSRIH